MSHSTAPLLSIVIPVYNEAVGLFIFHQSLIKSLNKLAVTYEIIYCDDGSLDGSAAVVRKISVKDKTVRLLALNRNFGKEIAITAGIHEARGNAILMIDADGQHPVELIPKFFEKWREGSKVVVGIRTENQQEGFMKRYGSRLFYMIIGWFMSVKIVPNSTDFRLIDQIVQQDFVRMNERNRITRGLIDWLGYKQDFITFQAKPRHGSKANYTFTKLFKLAIDSIVSLSVSPLYITAYIGAFVLPLSILLGAFMVIETLVGDPLQLNITGSAYIIVLLLFFVGILLTSQGIIGLYLSRIHTETRNRPLYIIDQVNSIRLHEIK